MKDIRINVSIMDRSPSFSFAERATYKQKAPKNLRIYLVLGVQGSMTCTTIKACKKWLAIMSGLKGVGSS